jgi:flagellin-like protein
MSRLLKNKKSLSAVIATVLLIMLTIAAVAILYAFVVPWVKCNLNKSKQCFDSNNQLSIDTSSGYTCTKSSPAETWVMIKRGENPDFKLKKIIVLLTKEGASNRYEIQAGTATPGVTMYNVADQIVLPNPGESKTYKFPIGNEEGVEILPMISGECGDISCSPVFQKLEACA